MDAEFVHDVSENFTASAQWFTITHKTSNKFYACVHSDTFVTTLKSKTRRNRLEKNMFK
jgi:hypothetical protein